MKSYIFFFIISLSVLLRMRNVADKNYRENQNSHILCPIIFFFRKSCRLCNNMENIVEAGGPQMTIWRTRIECWITEVYTHTHTHTHTLTHLQYVILTAPALQQWLHERSSILCYTYIA
jgi:hypothetical protein